MKQLTVDLGNRRTKLRLWETGAATPPSLVAGVDLESAPAIEPGIRAWLGAQDPVDAAALCSVAAADLEEIVLRALRSARASPVYPDPGLSIDCREPEKVGRDRLFAARAALDRAGGDAIVVDAGTALTVDAVRADRVFLGGAIAPGPELLARALAEGTARLPRVDPRPGVPALGRDTASALLSGIAVGFRGAARELVLRVGQEAGLAGAPVLLTGGARGFLLDPPALAARTIEEPDLVHLGLLAALRDSLALGLGTT